MDKLQAAIEEFPKEFHIRADRSHDFRIAEKPASFLDGDKVWLVVQINREGKWLDYARVTPLELRQEIIKKPSTPAV